MAAFEQAVARGRDEGQCLRRRPRDRRGDGIGSGRSEVAEPVVLPAGDDPTHPLVVDDRRTGGRERDAPARALDAAADGPRGRRAATLAERRPQWWKRVKAVTADRGAGAPAAETALREQQLEHGSRLRVRV